MKDVPEANDKMVIVYDGLCPFCTSYVRLMSLRRSVGAVELVDARSAHPEVQRLVKRSAGALIGLRTTVTARQSSNLL